MSNRAPPLLPWETGAVNWIMDTFSISRKPEMIPSETELNSPRGLPMATTFCPRTSLLVPSEMGIGFLRFSMRRTARSKSWWYLMSSLV